MKISKKYQIGLISLGILIILSIVIGLSYSYWQATSGQAGTNEVNTGCLDISYEETGTDIKLDNAYPINDEEGLAGVPYKFKITNNCTIDAKYDITLNSLGNKENLLSEEAIAYSFGLTSNKNLTKNILSTAQENTDTKSIDIANLIKSYVVGSGTLKVGDTKEYQLLLWVDKDASMSEMQKTFSAKIYITAVATDKIISDAYLMKATDNEDKERNGTVLGNEDILKEKIENIYTVDTKKVPEGAITSWDVSSDQSGDIIAYIKANGEDKYDLYIGEDGGVKANPDSSRLFCNYENVKSIDLSHFDTSNVTDMRWMFSYCKALTELDLSSFDTSNVIDMLKMFSSSALVQLDLSFFNTSNVTNMAEMFAECRSLVQLDVSHFDTSNVTTMYRMFAGCEALAQLDLTSFDTSKVINMNGMFSYCILLTQLDVTKFDTSNVTNMSALFHNCRALSSLDVTKFDTSNVTDMEGMFRECSALTQLDLSHFDTLKVTNMSDMFYESYALTQLDLSSFDTSSLTYMSRMFFKCSSLVQLNLSSFNTLKVHSMYEMFMHCSALTQLDLSSFDTSNVSDMREMFRGCKSLTQLDLRNMIFDKVGKNGAEQIFDSVSSTITIYVKDSTQADILISFDKYLEKRIVDCTNGTCP